MRPLSSELCLSICSQKRCGQPQKAVRHAQEVWRCLQFPADPAIAAAAQEVVQQWSPLASHPNLSTPAEAFVTAQLEGGPALVLVHAYHPAAITLDQAHMHQRSGASLSMCPRQQDCREP